MHLILESIKKGKFYFPFFKSFLMLFAFQCHSQLLLPASCLRLLWRPAPMNLPTFQRKYNPNYSSIPRVLMFAHVYPGNTYDLSKKNPSSEMPQDVGSRTICSSSGITTSNGIVHVLAPYHQLFFNQY